MDFRVAKFPKLPSPEEGLRNLVGRAPQAEAWADHVTEKFRPTFTTLYNVRRHIATGTVALLTIWFFVHVMFGANGMVVYRQKKTEYQSLQKEINHLNDENGHYSQQIKALQTDPKAIEKEARETLHYARPGEVIYVAPAPVQAQPIPESRAAKK